VPLTAARTCGSADSGVFNSTPALGAQVDTQRHYDPALGVAETTRVNPTGTVAPA